MCSKFHVFSVVVYCPGAAAEKLGNNWRQLQSQACQWSVATQWSDALYPTLPLYPILPLCPMLLLYPIMIGSKINNALYPNIATVPKYCHPIHHYQYCHSRQCIVANVASVANTL